MVLLINVFEEPSNQANLYFTNHAPVCYLTRFFFVALFDHQLLLTSIYTGYLSTPARNIIIDRRNLSQNLL